ncbi:MAG TPA: ATP synthase F1 subunit epsilon [Candidatus Binatia bacterium]|jgi:F-type H+-transporting ATPase subunit epsilon|nr:ATP synthase F1 subunit epsilon [Candidatus Binatia bacterium]
MQSLKFELITPERVVLKDEFDAATVPTREGEITVLPGHVPLVASLAPGMITVVKGGNESYLAVSGGFIEVQPDSRMIILADTAERAEELEIEKVEAARERAEKLLLEKRHVDDLSSAAAMAALERELARAKVARKHRAGRRQLPR